MYKSNHFQSKASLYLSFGSLMIGNVTYIAAISGMSFLLTSLNVEDGVGSTTLLTSSISSLIFGSTVVPIVLYFIHFKIGLVSGGVGFLVFILSNLYSGYYTLIPGAVCLAYGRAIFWITGGTFIAFFANEYHVFGTKDFSEYFSIINAMQFGAVQTGVVVGNLLSFAIFSLDDSNSNSIIISTEQSITNTSPLLAQTNATTWKVGDICGANDCQDPTITKLKLSNYVTPDERIRYITVGVLGSLILLGAILQSIFLPKINDRTNNSRQNSQVCKTKQIVAISNVAFTEDESTCRECSNINNDIEKEKTSKDQSTMKVEICLTKKSNPDDAKNADETKKSLKSVVKDIASTFKQFIRVNQLLITALQLQAGLTLAFSISELTRAYVSCVYGVSKIGISMCFYGLSSFIFAITAGKISGRFGRKYSMGVGYIITCSFYLFALLWVPTEDSSIVVGFVLVMMHGGVDGFIRTLSSEVTLAHSMGEKKAAFVCWFVWSGIGMMIQYSWSTSVCVRQKIYVMFATLTFATITYGIAERMFEKKTIKSNVPST